MQPKFKVGDVVKVLRGECVVQSPGKRVIYDCKDVVGRIKSIARYCVKRVLGVDECYRYEVDVHFDDVLRTVVVSEDDLVAITLSNVMDLFDVDGIDYGYNGNMVLKLKKKGSDKLGDALKAFRDSLMKCFMDIDAINVRSMLSAKPFDCKLDLKSDFPHVHHDPSRIKKTFFDNPFLSDELREKIHKIGEIAVDAVKKESESQKMPKSRCIKLLESYRAEREKVKKGRRFERCLRDSVVDEALERAIELLKGGES